jgi:hypothetical protein
MKKCIPLLIGFVCILATFPLSAQEYSETPSLAGVWQFCIPVANTIINNQETGESSLDTTKLKGSLIFKILGKSGDFINLVLAPGSPYITAYGTYDIVSTDMYVEHVQQSYTDPVYNGEGNTLSYHFFGNNYCLLSYTSPKTGGKAQEFWKRVNAFKPLSDLPKPKSIALGEKD